MEEEGKDKSNRTAAFSVYYGTDDSRNLVQRLSMKGTDDLEYVYIKVYLFVVVFYTIEPNIFMFFHSGGITCY
jgi:hypothetical protein